MSKRYTKDTFSEALDRRLSGFQADPWLARRVIGASEGEKTVKKLSAGAILVIALLCIVITGAVAAVVGGWNLNDFWNQQAEEGDIFLPAGYEKYIENKDVSVEGEHAVCTVQGTYYDGLNFQAVVNVAPKENVLPVEASYDPDKLITDMYSDCAITEEITLAEYVRKYHDGYAAIIEGTEQYCGDSYEYTGYAGIIFEILNEDGSMTFLIEDEMEEDDLPEKEIKLQIHYQKAAIAEDEDAIWFEPEGEEEVITIPLTVHREKSQKYICDKEFVIPDVGVKVTSIEMTVTPLAILSKMDMEVTDTKLYTAQWGDEEYFSHTENLYTGEVSEYQGVEFASRLDFEFVYPEGKEEGTERKKVPWGVSGSNSGSGDFNIPYAGATFHLQKTISIDALSDHYAIRGYNWRTGERFDAVEFTVKPVEE